MIKFKVKSNFDQLEKHLQNIYKDQIPYATAVALTRVAQKSQAELKNTLKDYFVVRNNYVQNSIRIVPAKKKDWPYCSSMVGSINPNMDLQVIGGEKESKDTSIPLGVPKTARRTPESKLNREEVWVKNLKDKVGFITITSKYGTKLLLKQTKGKVRDKTTSIRLRGGKRKVLYALYDRVRIEPVWKFEEIVKRVVAATYKSTFIEEFFKAIKSAKRS